MMYTALLRSMRASDGRRLSRRSLDHHTVVTRGSHGNLRIKHRNVDIATVTPENELVCILPHPWEGVWFRRLENILRMAKPGMAFRHQYRINSDRGKRILLRQHPSVELRMWSGMIISPQDVVNPHDRPNWRNVDRRNRQLSSDALHFGHRHDTHSIARVAESLAEVPPEEWDDCFPTPTQEIIQRDVTGGTLTPYMLAAALRERNFPSRSIQYLLGTEGERVQMTERRVVLSRLTAWLRRQVALYKVVAR